MSSNLNLVRSILAAWERGDFDSAEWAHPEIEIVYVDGPEPGTWKGLTGMAAAMRDWLHAWNEWRVESTEYRELDAERVLVLVRFIGRGKTSGLEVAQMRAEGAHVFRAHDGKVTRLVAYWNRERALADLGLDLEADSQR